jgi:hypothetical protein
VDSVAPQHVDVANRNVDFKVTVLKDPVDEGAGGTLQEGVWVVPVVGGKPDVGKAVKAEFVRKSEGANGKHVFEAQLNAKQLPAFYSLGVVVTKTTDGKTTNFLFHRSSIDGTNPFAGGGKPEEPKKDAPEEPPKPLSSASISTMGNLTTSPYQKVSDLFDIALYPDFTEQYAARAAGNIGYAKADLAFENGWLAERVSMEMDNRELGLLIADTARKLVDVGIAAVSPAAAAADLVAQQPVVDRMRLQAEARRDKVQLRVDLIEYAVPGMHPLLKPEEYGSSDRSPRVEYQRRSRYVISLINLPPRPSDSPPAQAGLSQDDQSKLMEVVLGDGWKLVAEHAKVFKEDPQFTIKNDALAGASPLGVLPITYKKSAVKSGVSSEQRGAYFKELTDAVVKKTGVQTLKSIEATPE